METGPVAQRIRARGYEPRCRGFESLLAHNQPPIGSLLFDGRRAGSSNYDWRSGRKAMELGPFSTEV